MPESERSLLELLDETVDAPELLGNLDRLRAVRHALVAADAVVLVDADAMVLWIKEQGARGAGLGARGILAVVTCHRRGNLVGARYAQARCGDVAGNIVCLDARRHTGLAPNAA